MLELAMHVLDIVENSVRAGADEVVVRVEEDEPENHFEIQIIDNGRGMSHTMSEKALDPFTTTKKGKRVGLGLSLLREAAERCNGSMTVESRLGEGTLVTAAFERNHIDRQPLGDMTETMMMLIIGNPDVDFQLVYRRDGSEWSWDTGMIRERYGALFRSHPEVQAFIREGLHFIRTAA